MEGLASPEITGLRGTGRILAERLAFLVLLRQGFKEYKAMENSDFDENCGFGVLYYGFEWFFAIFNCFVFEQPYFWAKNEGDFVERTKNTKNQCFCNAFFLQADIFLDIINRSNLRSACPA